MAVSRLSQSTLQNAFSKYNSVWDGKSAVGSMEAISSITLSAAQSVIEFNNIPQTYTHLQIRYLAKNTTTTGTDQTLYAQFNGDTASNYSWHRLYAYNPGNTVTADNAVSQTQLACGFIITSQTSPNNLSNMFSNGIVDILDYANTNKNKTVRALTGDDGNTVYGAVGIVSGLWFKSGTPAITSISLTTGNSFATYSSFALYGIK